MNRVTMLRESVVAEIPASRPDRRRWLLVQPHERGAGVSLVEFEHSAVADTDGWFSPDDILDRVESQFADLDSLLVSLGERGIDSQLFDAPWKKDYPL